MRPAEGHGPTALRAIMFGLRCRFGWSEFAPPPHREPLIGKKAAADRDAQSVPSDWADLILPRTRAN
jgi:hypothetical protein